MDGFAALAHPTRRAILELLAQGEHSAGAIAQRFAVSAPAISQHLRALRRARLVRRRVAGQRRLYRLDPRGFGALDAWLERLRSSWDPRPDVIARDLSKPRRRAR